MTDKASSDFKNASWLKNLYEQAPMAIGIYLGDDHIIEFANSKMLQIWDRSLNEVLNKPLFSALPEVSDQGYERILKQVLKTGEAYHGNELPALLKRDHRNELTYINVSYEALKNEEGEFYGILQAATDVTEMVNSKLHVEKSEQMLRTALGAGSVGTWTIDLIKNEYIRTLEHDKIFGFEELQANWSIDKLLTFVHDDDIAAFLENYNHAFESGQLDLDFRIIDTNDELRWLHMKGSVYVNLNNKPLKISGIIVDATRRKQAEQYEIQLAVEKAARKEAELHERELIHLFMDAPALICTLKGPKHIFSLVNPQYQAVFKGRKLKGLPILEALPELEGQAIPTILDNVYKSGETYYGNEVPVFLKRKHVSNLDPNQKSYFNFIYQATKSRNGKIDGILVFAYEITDQIIARKRIEESENRLKLALNAGQMGTWNLDMISDTSIRSAFHDTIFGYDQPVHQWGFGDFIDHVQAPYRQEVYDAFKLAKEGADLDFEVRIHTRHGQERWVAVRGLVTKKDEDGQALKMAGIVADITDRKKAEESLHQMTEELAASNEELSAANEEIQSSLEELSQTNNHLKLINSDLDNFIYTASHDLKAPISNIEGLMTMLQSQLRHEPIENSKIDKTVTLINSSVERFKNTIGELTDIAKLQKEVEEYSNIDFQEIINDAQLDLQNLIEQENATIIVDIEDCLEIQFSYKNLKSIIYNLLSNAIKYRSPDRDPEISIRCSQEDQYKVITMQDNGLGIEKNDLDKIFYMFKRLHTHVDGTGVGLYLVKRIMDNIEGKVEVHSELNKGTTFKLYFPF